MLSDATEHGYSRARGKSTGPMGTSRGWKLTPSTVL